MENAMRTDYNEYHLNPKKEVEKTRHLKGVEYMNAVLADMDVSELSGCDIYHSNSDTSIELDYDGWTNPDDE